MGLGSFSVPSSFKHLYDDHDYRLRQLEKRYTPGTVTPTPKEGCTCWLARYETTPDPIAHNTGSIIAIPPLLATDLIGVRPTDLTQLYEAKVMVQWAANATGIRRINLISFLGNPSHDLAGFDATADGVSGNIHQVSGYNTIENNAFLYVYQNSGSSLGIDIVSVMYQSVCGCKLAIE